MSLISRPGNIASGGWLSRWNHLPFHLSFGLLAAFGLILRLTYWFEFSNSELFSLALGPDVAEYHQRALELVRGVWIADPPDIHAPLYSMFLAFLYGVFNCTIPAVRLIQLLLNWGAWLGLFLLIRRLRMFSPPVNWLFLFWAMGYGTLFFHQGELISESILNVLLIAALGCLFWSERTHRRNFPVFAAGLCCGLAAVTHPMALFFCLCEGLYFAVRRKYVLMLLFGAAVLIPVLPVSWIASSHAGRPVLIQANSGFNLWLGNHAGATGGCYLRPGSEWKQLHRQAEAEAKKEHQTTDQWFRGKVFSFWLESPLEAAELWLRKFQMVWSWREQISGADPELVIRYTHMVKYSAPLLSVLFFFCWLGALQIWFRPERRRYVHVYLLLLAFVAAQVVTVTSGRYRSAMFIAVFLFAGWGMAYYPWRRWWIVPLGFLAAGAISYLPSHGLSESAGLYGEAAYQTGNMERARDLLSFARLSIHDPARFDNLLGMIEWSSGNPEKAETHFLRAKNVAPYEYEAWMNLANLYVSMKRDEEAEALYKKGVEKSPDYADLRFNYGYFLQGKKRFPEAGAQYQEAVRAAGLHAGAWNGLGIIAMHEGEVSRAVACFERASAISPENIGFLNNLYYAGRMAKWPDSRLEPLRKKIEDQKRKLPNAPFNR